MNRTGPEAGSSRTTFVTGSSGIVGRRVVAELHRRGLAARPASRSADPPFELTDPTTWEACLSGVGRLVLISPEGVPVHPDFLAVAAASGVERVSLLSDKGADVMRVERLLAAEQLVKDGGLPWSIVRPDWFDQDFDESFFQPGIMAGEVAVPIGEVRQGFIDAHDIAAVLVETLLGADHLGKTYVLTGPEALSFPAALEIIGRVSGRGVRFSGDADTYRRGQLGLGVDPGQVQRELDNFERLAALGDAVPTGDVERVLGRPATSFETYATRAAAGGAWC
jgi:uncharacterized protein YbjT (DUF2867 family)